MFRIVILLHCSIVVVTTAELGGVVCRLPKDVGYACGIAGASQAWYFENEAGECREFEFHGCGGNMNRFASAAECLDGCRSLAACRPGAPLMDFAGNIKRCDGERVPCPATHECIGRGMSSVCCMKPERVCQQSVQTGSACGVAPQTRYYFDWTANLCRPFSYTGCGGGENNFHSHGQCMQYCATEVTCPRGVPASDRFAPSRAALCRSDGQCPRNHTCTAGGGKREGACCPSKEAICGSPLERRAGGCRGETLAETWTFDHRAGACERVQDPPCIGEHTNMFASVEQCADYCIGSCPGGEEPHHNEYTGQPQLCDAKKKDGCPIGYSCVKSSPYTAVCCRADPLCPSAESILYRDSLQRAVRCSADTPCPSGYSCQVADNMESVCCTSPLECPHGMSTLRESGRPRVCSLGVPGNCPDTHLCTRGSGESSGGARHVCCRPEQKCVLPHVDETTKRPRKCLPGDGSCPEDTHCLHAADDSSKETDVLPARDLPFYCCHAVQVFTCPEGDTPLVDKTTGKPQQCVRSDPSACPDNLVCTTLLDGSSACCPHPVENEQCKEAIADEEGTLLRCVGWNDNSCARGKCRKATNSKYYCCNQ